ncbi:MULTISPECIES: phage major capsid protein [unclassified Thermoactinomyces]|uniref:phage major capsid protein n=1 Tax=unclassified Thermoactinomyces TaxID=2634588 RepID=UPI0018DD00FA|nr:MULTISPECIES: phage major capsid protein [unclassified Thermoactinomyces]MBH8599078.1 phage major capsid protein [Thermoactinomyces sp. CICC 10523]MBH8607991.1 phage major capsid protein [Thermoactinomyces sp. CICC 10521]
MGILVRNHCGKNVELKTGASLIAHLKERYKRTDSYAVNRYLEAEQVQLNDVFRAFGIEDIGKVQVRTVLQNDGMKPLFNAAIEDGLRMGFEKESNWQVLVADTVDATKMAQEWYFLEYDEDEVALREIGQGAPIPVGTLKIGDQSIRLHKRGRGIEWTDEAKDMNIKLVSLFLMKVGKKLGRDYENTAIYRLLNGYFPDGSDSPPVIGVKTANNLTIGDLFYAAMYMEEELGYNVKRLVMNRKTASSIAELKNGDGNYLFIDNLKSGEWPSPLGAPIHINNLVPDNRIILVDTAFALIRYSYKEFGVEFERSAKTQLEGSYGTEISEFVPFEKNARLIITLDQQRA